MDRDLDRMYEVYETDDRILPHVLRDAETAAIRVELHDDSVILHVAERDWFWNRKTGELDGAGTRLKESPDETENPRS